VTRYMMVMATMTMHRAASLAGFIILLMKKLPFGVCARGGLLKAPLLRGNVAVMRLRG